VKPNPGLRVAGANSAADLKHSFTYETNFTSSSRVFAPLKIEYGDRPSTTYEGAKLYIAMVYGHFLPHGDMSVSPF
jgi:hypothetical protein